MNKRDLFENIPLGAFFRIEDCSDVFKKVEIEEEVKYCYVGRRYIRTTNALNTSNNVRKLVWADTVVRPVQER